MGAKEATLICGSRTLSWLQLAHAYRTIEERLQMGGGLPQQASPYKSAQNQHVRAFLDALDTEYLPPSQKEFRHSLLRLLATFSDREASLNRDKVYAFLGMSNEGSQQSIASGNDGPRLVPDYRRLRNDGDGAFVKSDSEIFLDVAKFLIQATDTLDVVHACFFRSTQPLHPSWVPDWSIRKDEDGRVQSSPFMYAACPSPLRAAYRLDTTITNLLQKRSPTREHWLLPISHQNQTSQPVARFRIHLNRPCMVVQGFPIGRLGEMQMVIDFSDPWAFLRENIPAQIFDLLRLATRILSMVAACIWFVIEIIWLNPLSRRLFAYIARHDPGGLGPTFSILSEVPTRVSASGKRPITRFMAWRMAVKPDTGIRPPPANGWAFDHTSGFRKILPTLRTFSTYSPEAQNGDLVVMLVGAKMPMIIRQRARDSISGSDTPELTTFRFIGPGTFTHAIDRRAWKQIRDAHAEGRYPLEEFALI